QSSLRKNAGFVPAFLCSAFAGLSSRSRPRIGRPVVVILSVASDRKERPMDKSLLEDIQHRLGAAREELEQELDRQLEARRAEFRYRLQRGKVRFDREMRALQKTYRTGLWRYVAGARIATVLTAPVIYSLIVPLALLDLSVTI